MSLLGDHIRFRLEQEFLQQGFSFGVGKDPLLDQHENQLVSTLRCWCGALPEISNLPFNLGYSTIGC
jgi:hypothetical protein